MVERSEGGIWEHEGKNGKFLSGKINVLGTEVPFIAFRKKTKKNPKEPDWDIKRPIRK